MLVDNLNVCEYIEKSGSGVYLRFRYRYYYKYTENNQNKIINIVVDCKHVSGAMASGLYNNTKLEKSHNDPGYGKLSELKDKKILIIGNSFVYLSHISDLLTLMIQNNNKGCTVYTDARPNASIDTFVSDSKVMTDISSGKYDAVFTCGLYNTYEITKLEVLKKACDSSGTKVIIFPAHNEDRSAISDAKRTFPQLQVLDWKAEIDYLIESGIDEWYFCKNDGVRHSTPLAGYVGAHMIYRSIYGEDPKGYIKFLTIIDQSYINSILGDYKNLKPAEFIKSSDIHFLD